MKSAPTLPPPSPPLPPHANVPQGTSKYQRAATLKNHFQWQRNFVAIIISLHPHYYTCQHNFHFTNNVACYSLCSNKLYTYLYTYILTYLCILILVLTIIYTIYLYIFHIYLHTSTFQGFFQALMYYYIILLHNHYITNNIFNSIQYFDLSIYLHAFYET